MSQTTIIVLVVIGVVIIIAALAWAIYKAGFRPTEMTVKTGPLEAKLERTPPEKKKGEDSSAPAGPSIRQRATAGGTIKESGITAPADSEADIDQQAKDEGSKIDDSPINLT